MDFLEVELHLIEEKNKIILKDMDSFDPKHIFECGQAFRWTKEENNSYTLVAHEKIINLQKIDNDIHMLNVNGEDFENIWYNYFDLKTDYSNIKTKLAFDDTMTKAISYGDGLRVLNQDPYETIISFIISANNQIPRIKKSIELIANTYGKLLGEFNGRPYYAFPTPEELSSAPVCDVREICRVGFRDERIVLTSQLIRDKVYHIEKYFTMDRETARKELIELPGIGKKIADCVLLFAFEKKDSFPVDVWIKRVMEALYLGEPTNINRIGEFGREKYGEYAGIAQQYLFYYGRENSIGK